jgi:hypothetical protein
MPALLEKGDIIRLDEGRVVYAKIPEHFLYPTSRGVFEIDRDIVRIGGDIDWLAGEYLVTEVTEDGGGWAHRDRIEDGHHVWCEKLEGGHLVDFYQTPHFAVSIMDIEPIRSAAKRVAA